jgi:hypothetical protein
MLGSFARHDAEVYQVERRPRLRWWGQATVQVILGLVVGGSIVGLGLVVTCCDATDRFLARFVTPIIGPLVVLAAVNQVFNDANVVYDDERISKPTWLGRYGVKTLRWQDVVHVHTLWHRGGLNPDIHLHGVGTRITVRPHLYTDTDREEFEAEMDRHLQHVGPSERSIRFSRGGY